MVLFSFCDDDGNILFLFMEFFDEFDFDVDELGWWQLFVGFDDEDVVCFVDFWGVVEVCDEVFVDGFVELIFVNEWMMDVIDCLKIDFDGFCVVVFGYYCLFIDGNYDQNYYVVCM